jgi:hypothetical protein
MKVPAQMFEGDAIYVCSVTALYSTGHWIGATVLLAIFLIAKSQ